MDENKFRHEYKHVISFADYMEMRPRLNAVMQKDRFSNENGTYLVRSLYFDNCEDKALREKEDGVNVREKFRIRYYNGDISFIRLEKKSKINGLCLKKSAEISEKACFRLLNGEIDVLARSKNLLLMELYVKMKCEMLRPRVIVDYTREAYMYTPGNVRITFDSNIKSSGYVRDFMNPELATYSPGGAIILEIKYDAFLPQVIRDITQLKNRHTQAFSKYAFARHLI